MNELIFQEIRDYISSFMDRYDYPIAAREIFCQALDKIYGDEVCNKSFFAPLLSYKNGDNACLSRHIGGKNPLSVGNIVEHRLNIPRYTTEFLLYMSAALFLEEKYREKGLDMQLFYDAMSDLKCKLEECHKVYKVWGSFVADWFNGFFSFSRFAFKRLQFDMPKRLLCPPLLCGGKLVLPGMRRVDVHIPSSGALIHEDVLESYRLAYVFFAPRMKIKRIIFHTNSWLLFDEHKKMLSENSNIIKFMKDFKVISRRKDLKNHDFWRIFNRPYNPDKPDYSGESRLQRAYADYLSKGNSMGSASGIFIYDGKDFFV